jgi:adenylate cyclase
MGLEIERRFLVSDPDVIKGASHELIVQGYFFAKNGYAARVRRLHQIEENGRTSESHATMTLKGPRIGATRAEYEMEIDTKFAESMLREIDAKITKSRYQVISDGETWDVDVFHSDNAGLIIAECEMERDRVLRPPIWCSEEITYRREYDNENLAARPFGLWSSS